MSMWKTFSQELPKEGDIIVVLCADVAKFSREIGIYGIVRKEDGNLRLEIEKYGFIYITINDAEAMPHAKWIKMPFSVENIDEETKSIDEYEKELAFYKWIKVRMNGEYNEYNL